MDASPLQGSFPRLMGRFLGTISCPLALCQSEFRQGLYRFLDQATSSTWPDRVCWSRLVAVNCIVIMMASLDFRAHFGLSRRTVLGDLYCFVSLGVVFLIPVPGLVRLSSSTTVYLHLFWSSWAPSGRYLPLISYFLGRNFAF